MYLALQIRQNTRQVLQNTLSIQRESTRAFLEDANAWRSFLIQSPEIADLYRRGLRRPDELQPAEWLRFRMLMDNLFAHWRFAFYARDDAEAWVAVPDWFIERTLAEPGGARYWDTLRAQIPPEDEFSQHVDRLREGVRS